MSACGTRFRVCCVRVGIFSKASVLIADSFIMKQCSLFMGEGFVSVGRGLEI